MRRKQVYTVFVSSPYKSLENERNQIIKTLLTMHSLLPVAMEHFVVDRLSQIKHLIDRSDFFVALLGPDYGSCDEEGVSWSQREYEYAREIKKPIKVIFHPELTHLMNQNSLTLTAEQQKQVKFAQLIRTQYCDALSPPTISNAWTLTDILTEHFTKEETFEEADNWELNIWRARHRQYDLSNHENGIAKPWYHVHLSDIDQSYIRVGTVIIAQDFTPENYMQLHFEGNNYDVTGFASNGTRKPCINKKKFSRFSGTYYIDKNQISGIYDSRRFFTGIFGSTEIQQHSVITGVHRLFFMEKDADGYVTKMSGSFDDVAPSPKIGSIYLFRYEDDRDSFLLKERGHIINKDKVD